MKQLVVGIIGAGRIGKLHAENILYRRVPNMRLKAIADPYLDMDWVKNHNLLSYASQHFDDILKDPDIDAILICTPVSTHAPLIIAAANVNKHVFCEKPISLDVNEIQQALEVVKQTGIKLQIGFNRRFDPQFSKIAESVRLGKVGKPHLLRLTFRDPEPPPLEYVAQSGGIFLDMSIHDFDMARFLLGEEIVEIYATGSTLINPEFLRYDDVDTTVIQLRFSSGALGVIDNSRKSVYGYDQRAEVFGHQGCMIAENHTPTRTKISTAKGVISDKPLYFFLERYKQSYIAELKSFCESLLNDKPCFVNGHDGLMSTVLGLAAKQSLKENRPISVRRYE